jgi:UDP-N-acetyl-D-glucosamine dehydrogenase
MTLREKLERREAKVGVIGLGYVGLPLSVEIAKAGFMTIGIDVSSPRVKEINQGRSFTADISSNELAALVTAKKFVATTNYARLAECDVINICVPTPFTRAKDPDISFIIAAGEALARFLRPGQLVVLRSTTFPETTEKVLLPILERSKLRVGKDFYLSFAPERIDPGNQRYGIKNTPMVVGGVTETCGELSRLFYAQLVDTVKVVSSPRIAEMTKLLENIFRSVNIALVNELALFCERMGGLDIWEIIDAAATKPFGFMPFYPGPGIGGHCILVDPYYLSWKAKEYDFHSNFIEFAAQTNENMPFFVAQKTIEALSAAGICPSRAKVLILGAAFKNDIGDIRNSPAIKVMEILESKITKLSYNDPFVAEISINSHTYRSVELTPAVLRSADCIVITAAHSVYDFTMIANNANLIVDTRNGTKTVRAGKAKIIKIGRA